MHCLFSWYIVQKLTAMSSLERIQGYLDIDHEPKPSEGGKPPASWPTSGDLRVEELSARYSAVRMEQHIGFYFSFIKRHADRSQGFTQPILPYTVWRTHWCW